MSSLYFGLDVFCESKPVSEFDAVFGEQCTLYSPQLGLLVKIWALAPNKQNTASPKYNDDISLLISQYLISGCFDAIITVV
jgi:hypothetical protein